MKIIDMTVSALSQALAERQLSSLEAAEAYLASMDAREPEISAYITPTPGLAREQAAAIDRRRAAGESLSPLAGIPAAIKDNICTKGVLTTCASKMLSNFVPPYSATVMERLQELVLLGKANMDEFAMGSTTENSYFHPTRNPRKTDRVPGGSSGGSAAAVAAREAAFSLGSDTGGSIRQPAAFCGVVGMKPTYGAVSRYGLVAFASSLDQIGPLTRTVEDNALVLDAIAGWDAKDSTSVRREYSSSLSQLREGVKGMKVALPKEYFGEGLSPAVKEAVLAAAKGFEALGARIVETSMPSLDSALPAYYILSSAEASSNLARFDGVKYGYRSERCGDIDELYQNSRSEGFGKEVQRRIMLGAFALSAGYYDAYYKKALQARTLISQDFGRILADCSFVLSPVAPTTAYRLGEKTADPLEMYLGDVYTVPVNIAGLPALSLPCGVDEEGLPIGMQIIGRAFDEPLLYRAGYAFEESFASTKGGR